MGTEANVTNIFTGVLYGAVKQLLWPACECYHAVHEPLVVVVRYNCKLFIKLTFTACTIKVFASVKYSIIS